MSDQAPSRRQPGRLAPLAGAVLLALGSAAHAATITVTHAGDAHVAGGCSLREALQAATQEVTPAGTSCAAGSGNDLVQIPLPLVTLTQGALVLDGNGQLVIRGTGTGKTLIRRADDATEFRLIDTAVKQLTLDNLHLDNGSTTNTFGGGALLATQRSNTVDPARTTVIRSTVSGSRGNSGGGIANWNKNELTLQNSTVAGNTSVNSGGGIYSRAKLTVIDSTIEENTGRSGGGISAESEVDMRGSTVSDNIASNGSGGGLLVAPDIKYSAAIENSTITGNISQGASRGGGIFATGFTAIRNSTVTDNHSEGLNTGGGVFFAHNPDGGSRLTLTSTLVSGNFAGKYAQGIQSSATITVSGSHNLVRYPSDNVTLPADTVSCSPVLGPLANNGGPTRTRALRVHPHPATGCAFNAGLAGSATFDQRGEGYPRVVGSAADIGAFEYSDLIFANGFQ